MKQIIKRILASLMVVVMVLSAIPFANYVEWGLGIEAKAVSGVEQRLQSVVSLFPNYSYFSVNGQACPAGHGSACSNCYYPNVVSQRLGWNWSNMYSSWSCYGFTCFVTRYIFGTEWTQNSYVLGTANVSNTSACDSLFNGARIGDVVSIGTAHRVIFLRKSSNGIIVYDANQGDSKGLCNQVRYEKEITYSGIKNYYGSVTLTVNRMNNYESVASAPPSYAQVKTNKLSYAKGETVTFAVFADGSVNDLWIYYPDGSSVPYSNIGSSYQLVFQQEGQYQALIQTWTDFGNKISERITFMVGPPTKAEIRMDQSYCEINKTVNFTVYTDGLINDLWIYYPDGSSVPYSNIGSSYQLEFSQVGQYQALVQTWNDCGNKISEKVYFSVYDTPTAQISSNKDTYMIDELIEIQMSGINNGYYTLGVWLDSKRIVTQDGPNNNYVFKASEPGIYMAYCTSYGADKIADSEKIYFKVIDNILVNYLVDQEVWKKEEWITYDDNRVTEDIPVRAGYKLKEWNTKPDGTGVSYQPGDIYSENADLTLYAIWELDHEHQYISEITQQPTCTEKGIKVFTCSLCNDVYYEDIDELGHDYIGRVTELTCTSQGFTTYECSRCDDSYTENYIEPLNHSSSSWHTAINPTATSEGLAEKRCDYCGIVLDQFTIPCLEPDYVTGITLSSEKETVEVGDIFTLSATVIPDTAKNKNVIWSSRNPDIVSVDNGKVTAIKPGTTAIVAETEDGGYIDFCLVRVISLVAFNGSVIDTDRNIIYGLSSNLESVDDYLKTADDSMTVTLSTSTVGTGTFINVMDNGEIVDLYEAVVFGDVNGDSWYDGQDAVLVSCLANGMLTKDDVSEAVYMAADCNHDGVIDQLDVAILNEAGTLLANVDQTKPTEVLLETSSEYVEYLELIDQSPEIEDEKTEGVPEVDVESEDTTPEQGYAEVNIFEMIINFIKSIFELLFTYIPVPIN